jgi:hypothetical protein
MIKAICFDLDGVYFLDGKEKFISALQNLGVSNNETKMSGAQELGINTFVYTTFENFVTYLENHGVTV